MSSNTFSIIQSFVMFGLVFIILHQKFTIDDLTAAYTKCAEYRTCEGIE